VAEFFCLWCCCVVYTIMMMLRLLESRGIFSVFVSFSFPASFVLQVFPYYIRYVYWVNSFGSRCHLTWRNHHTCSHCNRLRLCSFVICFSGSRLPLLNVVNMKVFFISPSSIFVCNFAPKIHRTVGSDRIKRV
jgi:hypothetical protein